MRLIACQLDVTREASDVLEAANSSVLTISSNSSSLTDWDAKLGFQKQIYVASLRSLSPEGGVATLLDLTIVRIYPIGYSEAGKDPREIPPWDEKEEVQRQVDYEVRLCHQKSQTELIRVMTANSYSSIRDRS